MDYSHISSYLSFLQLHLAAPQWPLRWSEIYLFDEVKWYDLVGLAQKIVMDNFLCIVPKLGWKCEMLRQLKITVVEVYPECGLMHNIVPSSHMYHWTNLYLNREWILFVCAQEGQCMWLNYQQLAKADIKAFISGSLYYHNSNINHLTCQRTLIHLFKLCC